MRKYLLYSLILVLSITLGYGITFALESQDGAKLSGPHWGFNIIGHPNNKFSGDSSNGRTIMVPLKNANSSGDLVCNVDGVVIVDDTAPTYTTSVPTGARIYFTVCDTCTNFEISDRDALDGRAEIKVPASLLDPDTKDILFDIYLRVLGKPNTCMNINAYAFDLDQSLYFWAGSAYISRKTGKSTFVKANDLFDVNYCQVDPISNICVDGTTQELSVFNDVFEEYFWNILNDGTRLVQVRVYW